MPSIFSRIVAGEIPCHRIAESDRFLAFLDVNPLTKGHSLVIPKQETDYLFDLPDTELGDLLVFAKQVARAVEQNIPCTRIGVAVIGLEVPHAHVHLVPIRGIHDLNFANPRVRFTQQEFADTAQIIRATWEQNEAKTDLSKT